MKYLFIVLMLGLVSTNLPADITKARLLFTTAADDEDDYEDLLAMTANVDIKRNPELYGYAAGGTFIQAEYVFMPSSKLKCVDKGRKMLEEVIQLYPNNIELRFIRLSIQSELPFFIDYRANIEEDKVFLKSQLSQINDQSLVTLINHYL